ncbi:hypothetical protein CROQUDRAFT_131579 [Cronartium quercuum f. sp. fusiforme G11]|uniref:Uncharacterized protein n=1 Tax=Cronartium quercuum f. sp. fusiforme G11 TaxID=708437 RepID=A0A9P6TFS9_9BASI|nr:hypothetical protein CROQUDRAFT_131579 [Cronartium quercuum f. sp. fusiforme G11]
MDHPLVEIPLQSIDHPPGQSPDPTFTHSTSADEQPSNPAVLVSPTQPTLAEASSTDVLPQASLSLATEANTPSPAGSSPTPKSETPASTSSTPSSLVANPKKFKASSLSVNKKFLSQSTTSDGKSAKNSFTGSPRVTSLTPSTNSSPQGTGPRLLTGKISANSSILNASGSSTSGWARTPLVVPSVSLSGKSPEFKPSALSNIKLAGSSSFGKDEGSSAGPPKTGLNGFLQNASQHQPNPALSQSSHHGSSSPWGKFGNPQQSNGLGNLVNDFPTAQEVANHNKLKAQSMAAAIAARDKASQDRAAASAAYNQQLLQTLDGFRGTHLDPNASHWDEMEDEDDMFGEVVEFGDGTQYKVTEIAPTPIDPNKQPSPANDPASTSSQASKKEDRFTEDYDRTSQPIEGVENLPPFLRGRAELKSLFNERLGKFEPYSAKTADKPKDSISPVQLLQRQREHSGDSLNSAHQISRTQNSLAGDTIRPPSQPGSQATSHTSSSWRPSDLHRENTLGPPDRSRDNLSRTSLSQPFTSPRLPPPPSIESSSELGLAPNSSTTASKPLTQDSSLKSFKPSDLDELHRTEMMSAAERARKRRQEEEAAREAESQRAKQKAIEIEAKLKAAAAATVVVVPVKSPPSTHTTTSSSSVRRNYSNEADTRPGSRTAPTERKDVESWRARPVVQPSHLSKQPTSAATSEPSSMNSVRRPILSRPPPPSNEPSQRQTEVSGSHVERSSNALASSARNPSTLPPQEEAFKNRQASPSRRSTWKAQINSALSSQPSSSSTEKPTSTSSFPNTTSATIDGDKARRPSEGMETNWRQKALTTDSVHRVDVRQRPPHMVQNTNEHLTAVKPSKTRDIETTKASSSVSAPSSTSEPSSQSLNRSSASLPQTTQPTVARDMTATIPSSFTSRVSLQDKKPHPKLPDMSQLDTVMSRIKGVLEADKEARAKAVASAVIPASETPPIRLIQKPNSTSSSAIKPVSTPTTSLASRHDNLTKPLNPKSNSADVSETSSNLPVSDQRLTSSTNKPVNSPPQLSLAITTSSPDPSLASKRSSEPTAPKTAASATFASGLPSALSNPAEKKPTSIRKAARFDLSPQERHVRAEPKSYPVSGSSYLSRMALKREPSFVNRDPTPLWNVTKEPPPTSPEPAWKAYTVKLARPIKHKRKTSPHVLKAFWNPLTPARVNILTWDPPLANLSPRTLSRDDLLFRKKLIRGVVMSNVILPKKTIKRQLAPAENDHNPREGGPLFMRGRGRVSSVLQPLVRGRGRGRADGTMSWRRPIEEAVSALAVEPEVVVSEFDSPGRAQVIESPQAANATPSSARKNKSKLPEGSKVGFSRPPNVMSPASSLASGMFMVNSEITGEVLQPISSVASEPELKRSTPCSTPDDSTAVPLTPRRSSPVPVALTPPSSNIHSISSSKGSPSPWTKSPLAFSVLDSHTKNVWSQPDGRITTKPPPSGKIENSLEGIPDDFVAALPRTLNDFNTEDESSPVGVKEEADSFGGRENSSYISPRAPQRMSPTTVNLPSAQAGASATTHSLQLQPSSKGQDDRSMSNGNGQPPLNNSTSGTSHNPQGSSTQSFSGSFPSPSTFQVPPGYQLVPIGTVPPNPQPALYSGLSSIYPGQANGPWSPSLAPQQPSGYGRSPQLYPLTNFPPPMHTSGFPSPHSGNQTQPGGGFNKTPGPIAPRGGRTSSSASMHSPHLGRPSENSFVPAVGRNGNGPTNFNKSPQMPGYVPPPPLLPPPSNSIDLYGSAFTSFQAQPQLPNPFSGVHSGLAGQNVFSPSLTPSSTGNGFPGSPSHPGSGGVQSYVTNPLQPPSFVPQPPPHFPGSVGPQPPLSQV